MHMNEIETTGNRIHVCTLSTSALKAINREIEYEQDTVSTLPDEELDGSNPVTERLNRLRWVQLSMEYFINQQLQYVYSHLSNKSNRQEFRAVRMRPLFETWKKEVLRKNWQDVRFLLCNKYIEQKMFKKGDYFHGQRSELSSRYFANSLDFTDVTIDLITTKSINPIDTLVYTAKTSALGENEHFCTTMDANTISEVSLSESEEVSDDWALKYVRAEVTARAAGAINTSVPSRAPTVAEDSDEDIDSIETENPKQASLNTDQGSSNAKQYREKKLVNNNNKTMKSSNRLLIAGLILLVAAAAVFTFFFFTYTYTQTIRISECQVTINETEDDAFDNEAFEEPPEPCPTFPPGCAEPVPTPVPECPQTQKSPDPTPIPCPTDGEPDEETN